MAETDELEKLISGEAEKPKESSAEGEKPKAPEKSEEQLKKEEQLANVNKAITQANEELKKIRLQKKAEKAGISLEDLEKDELPKINLEDPNSKAWDRHMADKVDPLRTELERERDEVTGLALREFLVDKPALAGNPEKVKEFVRDYQALAAARGITGRNKEVVKSVMDAAYGSLFHEEVLAEARRTRVAAAKAEGLMADIVTDEGSGASFRTERSKRPALSKEMQEAVIHLYGSVENYWTTKEKADATSEA